MAKRRKDKGKIPDRDARLVLSCLLARIDDTIESVNEEEIEFWRLKAHMDDIQKVRDAIALDIHIIDEWAKEMQDHA